MKVMAARIVAAASLTSGAEVISDLLPMGSHLGSHRRVIGRRLPTG